ncbi:MAG TPA: methyltransferase domain-containing protein [Thermoguttaceae bacterium]|nr:methyltransferase domain-containing protein [Thermoguttaceae bacterium]
MHESPDEIQKAVRQRFSRIADTPERESKFPVGLDSARTLGYGEDELAALPSSVTDSFCGVGNPLGLGELRPGERVLDLGSGAGLDCLLAARCVGPAGKVVGVDVTEAMVEKARDNARSLGVNNVEFLQADVANLPLDGGSIDVAISNGVLNLCVDKPAVISEVYRVLRPGGRLRMADILLHEEVTPEQVSRKGTWSD